MSEILENYLTQFVKFFTDRYVLIGRLKVKSAEWSKCPPLD